MPAQQRLRRDCIYEEIRVMQPQAHLSIESMCRLAGASRAGFYRHWHEREPRVEEMELRAQVKRSWCGTAATKVLRRCWFKTLVIYGKPSGSGYFECR